MRGRVIAAACLALPIVAPAQNLGTPPTGAFPAPSSPQYQAPTVPPQPEDQLPTLPAAPTSGGSASVSGGKVFIKHVDVRGVTAFKPATIEAITKPYENRVVTAAELEELRVALTHLYVDKGYANSGVILPDQNSEDGVVVFQAIEGKLTQVQVIGNTHLNSKYISSRIQSQVDTPLNVDALQQALRYLQQDPNLARVDARLSPGDALGQSVLRLSVEDQPRFNAGVFADNYQSPSIGSGEIGITFGFRDLTGYGDEFKSSLAYYDSNWFGSAVFSIPFSAKNASFEAYYSRSNAVIIQQPFEELNIKETVQTYGILFTVPLVDRLNSRFALFLGGEVDHSYSELLDMGFSFSPGAENGTSDVTQVYGGLDWLFRGASTVTELRLTYRRGIDALGATTESLPPNPNFNPNPTGATGLFGLEQLQFVHIERLNGYSFLSKLNDRAQLLIRATGQLSQDPLLSLMKMPIGGIDTVRGFPESSFVRDNGAAATLELQLPLPGYRPTPYWTNLIVAPFVDWGRSWDKVNAQPGSGYDTTDPQYMAGAGFGLLWNPFKGFDAKVYKAWDIGNNFTVYNPFSYVPHDLQYHGIFASVSFVYRW